MQNKTREYDLLVMGGGPAGVSAALSFANKNPGSKIAIVDQDGFSVSHKIGEALLTATIMDIEKLGILDDVVKAQKRYGWVLKEGAAYIYGDDRIPWVVNADRFLADDEMNYPPSMINPKTGVRQTLMVKRHEFDQALLMSAAKKGVDVIQCKVKDVALSSNGDMVKKVEVDYKEGVSGFIRSRFYVDATGSSSVLGKALKVREPFFKDDFEDKTKTARYVYIKNFDFSKMEKFGMRAELTNIISSDHGWMWCIHTGGHEGQQLTSLGIVGTRSTWKLSDNDFFKALKNIPEYEAFGLDKAELCDVDGNPIEKPYQKSDYSFLPTKFYGSNWMLTGDAAAFIDPILSQGVTLAFHFGRKAGECISLVAKEELSFAEAGGAYESAYRNELRVLKMVVSMWYDDHKSSEKWRYLSKRISRDVFERDHISENLKGFQWVTSLENLHIFHEFKDEIVDISRFEKALLQQDGGAL
jgi:flavin-dependent dehydrogenase